MSRKYRTTLENKRLRSRPGNQVWAGFRSDDGLPLHNAVGEGVADNPSSIQAVVESPTFCQTVSTEAIMIAKQKLLELQENGYCVLRAHLPKGVIEACRDAFWPVLLTYLKNHGHEPNRGPNRHFLPMPFEPPCFAPEFFFDAEVLSIVRGAMGQQVVADQWGLRCACPGLGVPACSR